MKSSFKNNAAQGLVPDPLPALTQANADTDFNAKSQNPTDPRLQLPEEIIEEEQENYRTFINAHLIKHKAPEQLLARIKRTIRLEEQADH